MTANILKGRICTKSILYFPRHKFEMNHAFEVTKFIYFGILFNCYRYRYRMSQVTDSFYLESQKFYFFIQALSKFLNNLYSKKIYEKEDTLFKENYFYQTHGL